MNWIVERERELLELEKLIAELRSVNTNQAADMSAEIRALEAKYAEIQFEIFGTLTPWQKVQMARHPSRPTSLDYISQLERFDELHGDRHFRDDPA
ncbi:MAG: acetyl-CoA carboxylase carboxyl transferase subunit alpha, partial [Candidatus Eremiobacterales bacterium]